MQHSYCSQSFFIIACNSKLQYVYFYVITDSPKRSHPTSSGRLLEGNGKKKTVSAKGGRAHFREMIIYERF